VSLLDVVTRFSTSPERRAILGGFLRYRAELHRLGLKEGFQWLDGSFLEHVELIEGRGPRDVDVVTFFHTPAAFSLADEDARLFDQAVTKDRFQVDAYFVDLDHLAPRELSFWSAYWYSMWSHRRSLDWKGYLQVELAPDEDEEAIERLSRSGAPGGPS
jgi:hypothetical protein